MPRSSFASLLATADAIARQLANGPVATRVAPAALRRLVAERLPLDRAQDPDQVLATIEDLIRRFSVHVTHPRYFGLFNPSVLPETVAAAALTAVYNCQEAVWSHAPAAAEIEQHALRRMATLIGWSADAALRAHFTSGGQEANLSAVVVALAHAFPGWAEQGVRGLPADPVLYVAGEGHHSFIRAVRVCGLGDAAVRWVPVDAQLRMDVAALRDAIAEDRATGRHAPFLVVGTAGTTAAGAIDPLPAIADACDELGVWFHCDAAWGGGALLSPTLRGHLAGIERAHSVTWDAHKWLSCPMGSGAFLCRRPDAVAAAFDVASGYMPSAREGADDPHRVSMQWSRRAIGVPVAAALATRGPDGYAALIDHQAAMGDALRAGLLRAGLRVVNDTPLPLVCFTHDRIDSGTTTAAAIARHVERSGVAWVSPVKLAARESRVLRACITSFRTEQGDVDALIAAVTAALDA